jgi:hypothetical protein
MKAKYKIASVYQWLPVATGAHDLALDMPTTLFSAYSALRQNSRNPNPKVAFRYFCIEKSEKIMTYT